MIGLYPNTKIVLLYYAMEVSPGWLMELSRAANLSSKIGVSGAKTLSPDGQLWGFCKEFYTDGNQKKIGRCDDPEKEEYSKLSICGFVSGSAMYIMRSTIKKIGTFDEQFSLAVDVDSDFCYTVKEHGLVTVVTPSSVVISHSEDATSRTATTESPFEVFASAQARVPGKAP